jgi:hypothetical protein
MMLNLELDAETLARLDEQAKARGLKDARTYVLQLLREQAESPDDPQRWAKARQAVEQMKGTATRGKSIEVSAYLNRVTASLQTPITTEQIMDERRSEE